MDIKFRPEPATARTVHLYRYAILFVLVVAALVGFNEIPSVKNVLSQAQVQVSSLYQLYQSKHILPSLPAGSHEQANGTTTMAYQQRIEQRKSYEPYAALLWHEYRDIHSPDKGHRLRLNEDGMLQLQRKDSHFDQHLWTTLWEANTATENVSKFNGSNYVTLDPAGVLQVQIVLKEHKIEGNSTDHEPELTTVWYSDMLKHCDGHGTTISTVSTSANAPYIAIDNEGTVSVQNFRGQHTCTIYSGDPEQLHGADTWGRLAVVVSGLYRTLNTTCSNHMEKVINVWKGTGVDVFVYSYWEADEEAGEPARQRKLEQLRSCYGEHVKDIVMANLTEIEDGFRGPYVPEICSKDHIDRLHNQLKTAWLSAGVMQNYMIQTGTTYSTVLRLRTDTAFSGAPVHFKKPTDVGARIIIPQTDMKNVDKYSYCRTYDGGWTLESTDQVMYGGMTAAMTWFNLFTRFDDLMIQAQPGHAYQSFTFCPMADFPTTGHNATCAKPQSCVIECIVSYYLRLMGVVVELEWTWDQDVLRGGSITG
ncbi:hypothetical protein MBLNU457_4690t1 [Dothideomycetes sp. NU457]